MGVAEKWAVAGRLRERTNNCNQLDVLQIYQKHMWNAADRMHDVADEFWLSWGTSRHVNLAIMMPYVYSVWKDGHSINPGAHLLAAVVGRPSAVVVSLHASSA